MWVKIKTVYKEKKTWEKEKEITHHLPQTDSEPESEQKIGKHLNTFLLQWFC